MPLPLPPMPPRVAAIKAAIETRLDFSALADGGEAVVLAWAKSHGLRGAVLIREWQTNYRQAVDTMERKNSSATKSSQSFQEPHADLDHWDDIEASAPDDEGLPTDDEDDLEICKACAGRGRDSAGNRCLTCGGTGKAPVDDEDDSNEE
jgi:hypothetical protein